MDNKENIHISVVTPVYGCRAALFELYTRLRDTLEKLTPDFEIIMVNDASPDNAWETIKELATKDKRVKGINLSRNFGQHYAITAGLDYAKGEWVVVMDCDLQDRPEEIVKLYNKALEGSDIVMGKRISRQDTKRKIFWSKLFYKIYNFLTDSKLDPAITNFCIMRYKVVEALNQVRDKHRAFLLFIHWVGFSKSYIEINHNERRFGNSSYNFRKSFSLAINSMLFFSEKPLRIAIIFGIILTFFATFFILFKVALNLIIGTEIIGWSSLIATIAFSTGLIITIIGIVGLYLGSVFREVKQRPIYICSDFINI
jgi:polyisoprenyl-phosphate glycosyltransferase